MINRILTYLRLKRKPWNPINGCTLLQYSTLEDTSQLDLIIKHAKSNPTLLTGGVEIKPLEDDLEDFTFRKLISIRNNLDSGKVDEAIKKVYGIKDLSDCDVFSYASSVKWIVDEIKRIEKKESRLSSKKNAEKWKAAGIEKMQGFGRYVSLFMISKDITQENAILDMPYYRVFDRMEADKIWGEVQTEFNKISNQK